MITQKQWEEGTDPGQMIRSALHWVKNPERKARLYRVALVRDVWDELLWLCRVLTELAERQADGEFDPSALARPLEYIAEGAYFCAQERSSGTPPDNVTRSRRWLADYERYLFDLGCFKPTGADLAAERVDPERLRKLAWLAYGVHFEWSGPSDLSAKHGFDSVPVIRDIFGNPFRPATFDPAWRTDTAVSLASQMYESRDFGAMPILADALQDAGCDSEDILGHCRGAGPHVRGCWVVDLVLGKE
jgi:hypothetical protein